MYPTRISGIAHLWHVPRGWSHFQQARIYRCGDTSRGAEDIPGMDCSSSWKCPCCAGSQCLHNFSVAFSRVPPPPRIVKQGEGKLFISAMFDTGRWNSDDVFARSQPRRCFHTYLSSAKSGMMPTMTRGQRPASGPCLSQIGPVVMLVTPRNKWLLVLAMFLLTYSQIVVVLYAAFKVKRIGVETSWR